MTKKEEDLIDLLKSGNFSVHYHDNSSGCVYKNRFEYDAFMDDEGNDLEPGEEVFAFGYQYDGYLPDIVKYLVIALGGTSGSA